MKRRISIIVLVLTTAAVVVSAAEAPVFKIYVERSGVYELSYESLRDTGLGESRWSSTAIGLRNIGEPVARWADDGGDGVFGPGDRIVFVAERLHGSYSYLDEYSRFNCYVLDFADSAPKSFTTAQGEAAAAESRAARLQGRQHIEHDLLMLRYPESPDALEEKWYWARLSIGDSEPMVVDFDLPGLGESPVGFDAGGLSSRLRAASGPAGDSRAAALISDLGELFSADFEHPVQLRLSLRGWSEPRRRQEVKMPDHRVDLKVNGHRVGSSEWDGKDHHLLTVMLPPGAAAEADNRLEIEVPRRKFPDTGDPLIDVVMVNWVELEYPISGVVGDEQLRVHRVDGEDLRSIHLHSGPGDPAWVFDNESRRLEVPSAADRVSLPADMGLVWSVPEDGFFQPEEVILDRGSTWRNPANRADYLLITHHSLLDSAATLADFHRGRGLAVKVVDVQDLFDEFNHGLVHPLAIHDFLDYAYHQWARPAPRFVLLLGDASWDFKNPVADDENYADWTYIQGESRRFVKNRSTPYAENADLNHRNLVPTWNYPTYQGHAASDNWLACVDGDDSVPDIAIGRLPAATPEEAEGMIHKIITFADDPEIGPWRRNQLFITNESVGFQKQSDRLVEEAVVSGMAPIRVYPHRSEPANEHHTQHIVELFDQGLQVVHFIGHGGRYIWRTGPPDLRKNHDLFTLEHLDQLQPTRRLPVVISLTCYSAPFDHPTADSIGEKLVRLPASGAIAVFAASWRNSPAPDMGRIVLEELRRPDATVGEAIARTKARLANDMLNHTYNLLGDPATPVLVPSEGLKINLSARDGGLVVAVSFDGPGIDGQALLELVGEYGTELMSYQMQTDGSGFAVLFTADELAGISGLEGVRVYVWNGDKKVDALGSEALPEGLDLNVGAAAPQASGTAAEPTGQTPPAEEKAEPKTESPEAGGEAKALTNTLRWTTASEVDNFGFDIYRGDSEEGPFERISEEPIAGAGTTDEPQSYVFIDDTIEPNRWYYYYIESISMESVRERFSPIIAAKPKKPTAGD